MSDKLQTPPKYTQTFSRGEICGWRKEWITFLFGDDPLLGSLTNLNVIRGPIQEGNKIKRFHLSYEVEDNLRIDADVFQPKEGLRLELYEEKPIGVVCFHSSGLDAIRKGVSLDPSEELGIAAHLAELGYTVICPRCFIYGSDFDGENPHAHHAMQIEMMRERHPKWKGMARMICDGRRAVDVLVDFLGAHPTRVGAIGHSLGAKQVLYLMAFDERVATGVFSDGGIGLSSSNWDDVWYLGPTIRNSESLLENHQVLAMIAPRSFLLVGGKVDHDGAWPFVNGAIKLWKSYGSQYQDRVGWLRHHAGHRWPEDVRNDAYKFLIKQLTVK